MVAAGDTVKRGQTIARVGSSGHVDRPQLHFEVRRGTRAVNPEAQLAPRTDSAADRHPLHAHFAERRSKYDGTERKRCVQGRRVTGTEESRESRTYTKKRD